MQAPCSVGDQETESSWSTSSTWAGQKSASPGIQGNSQTSVRSASVVYAKDKHQQGLLGIANAGEISLPVLPRGSDYPTLTVPLEFTQIEDIGIHSLMQQPSSVEFTTQPLTTI